MQTLIHVGCFCAHHFVDDVSFFTQCWQPSSFQNVFPATALCGTGFYVPKKMMFCCLKIGMFWCIHFLSCPFHFFVLFLLYYIPVRILFSQKKYVVTYKHFLHLFIFGLFFHFIFLLLVDWCRATRTKEPTTAYAAWFKGAFMLLFCWPNECIVLEEFMTGTLIHVCVASDVSEGSGLTFVVQWGTTQTKWLALWQWLLLEFCVWSQMN